MKRVAITGHTRGLGAALIERFSAPFFISHGFSRSTGHDINDIDKISEKINDYDILINNAHDGFSQVRLLYMMHSKWHSKPKMIVNISSVMPDKVDKYVYPYVAEKAALDHAVKQLQSFEGNCKVVNVKFGKLENIPFDGPKISFKDAAEVVYNVVTSPINITSITVEPHA